MKTLASYFCQLREDADLTIRDIGRKCKLSQSTVWKIENGRTIKGDTLHQIIVAGLGFAPSTAEYKTLVALWAERHGLELPKLRGVAQKEWAPGVAGADLIALQKCMKDKRARSAIIALARHFAKEL